MSGLQFWSEVLQWVFLVVLTVMTTGLVYMVGDLSRRLGPEPGPLIPVDGLEIGTQAPELIGTEPRHGLTVRLSQYLGRPVVLAFLSPSCSPCVQLIGHLNREAGNRTDISFVVVAQPGNGVNYARELSRQVVVIEDPDYSISKAFEVQRTPLVYVLDPEGRVAHRTIPNDFLELEDTIAGLGRRGSLRGYGARRRKVTKGVMGMSTIAKKTTEWSARRQSRRGFLASAGKLVLGLGLAMVGMSVKQYQAQAACCMGQVCPGCPSDPRPSLNPCPSGCQYINTSYCCDNGVLHFCDHCQCTGQSCHCEYMSGDTC